MNEQTIFTAALEKGPAERPAFLDQACGGDAKLRDRVARLVNLHDNAGSFLEFAADEGQLFAEAQTTFESPGNQIGPYKLLQQIGEGGMGVVFMAEQAKPIHRKVALKVIKPGMDTRQVIARFEAERQALAMMDHVNIARVLDAGATDSGRPYFVMELVHGVPITRYCDENRLTPRERLELFVPVCQAIQHAHQKGIIHRDIKPSNIMITLYDGKPVPKVIDFGVAKAIEQRLTERTLFTHYGTMVGTPEYMSPEHAEMNALGADTRSDIFSLGVLLYELLTGSTPLGHKRLKEAAYGEILRIILEEEPPKPSTRLSESGDLLDSISAQRQTEPAKLAKLIRGELDWVVMKALEKDRNRRYETASALAADIKRFLNDELVQARPASASYRLCKFARRHRLGFATGIAVAAALLLGVAGTTGGMLWALQEREAAQTAAVQAELQAAHSEEVSRFLSDVATLSNIGHSVAFGRDTTYLRQVLDDTTQRFTQGDFKGQPALEANVRHSLGEAYSQLGDYEAAESMLRKSLALSRAAYPEKDLHLIYLADSLHQLALHCMNHGDFPRAEAVQREALSIYSQILDGADYRVMGMRRILTRILRAEGKLAEAERLYRTGLDMARKTNNAAWLGEILVDLGAVLVGQAKYAEAEPILREALAVREKTEPQESWGRYDVMSTLGGALAGQDRFEEAEPLLVEGYEGMSRDPESWQIRRREALERLIKLYEAWERGVPGKGHLKNAELWQRKLTAMDAPPTSAKLDRKSTD